MIQEQPVYADDSHTTVINPLLIAEILSTSTQNYDQGDKFKFYRSIPELYEYILIAQTQPYIMQYTKTESGQWLLSEYTDDSGMLSLATIPFEISLADLYEGVDGSSETLV